VTSGADVGADVQARREAVVRGHMESENRHEFDATLATFAHPRYEIIPTGDVYDGADAVMEYFRATRGAFPDQRNELRRLWPADGAVIAEFDLLGTHEGELRGIAATGKAFRVPMIAIFEFGDAEKPEGITCERVYFDSASMLTQLGVLG
jgi:steroid delta-isomerase-like uncharacterized protein